jgi:hypothetical protein
LLQSSAPNQFCFLPLATQPCASCPARHF